MSRLHGENLAPTWGRPPRADQERLVTEIGETLADLNGPCLTGLFDFEPAMIGDRAYGFVGVGLFVTGGDPHLMARLAKAYGHAFPPADLLAYTLLHVYSNRTWYLRELGAPVKSPLPALAEAWFDTA
jgi:hygromycin-B 7''-O-kinase